MSERKVQFSDGEGDVAVNVKTWPRGALKNGNQPPAPLPAVQARRRKQKVKAMVMDLYRGYRTLDDVDSSELVLDLIKDPGDNALMTWTVLNMIFRSAESRLQFHQTPEFGSDTEELDVCINSNDSALLVDRATTHFDVFSKSADVLDSRVLSQIMRTVELLWVRATREGYEANIATAVDAFIDRCIGLIRTKPNSKSLATTAIRFINLVDWSALSEVRIASLLQALSKTQLAFASSFAAESVVACTNAMQSYPEVMANNQNDWVPMALRSLFSNSPLTRSQALSLLQGCVAPSTIVATLNEPADAGNQPEALARVIARRLLAMIQVAGYEDARVLIQAWCLILKAVSEVDKTWPHLDLWLDIAKMAFRANIETAGAQWNSFLFIASSLNRPDILLYPFDSGIQLSPSQCANFIDSATRTFRVGEVLWDGYLDSAFKTLGQSENEHYPRVTLQRMLNILRPVPLWLGSNIGRVLSVCMVVFRNPASCPQLCASVWRLCAESALSRPQSMELLRFHYKFLFLDHPLASTLTSILIETWPLKALIDKAKSSNHSLLSLILLPITSFGTTDSRVEYVQKNVTRHFRSQSDILAILRVVLTTVTNNESQQSSQISRWSTATKIILNSLPNTRDRGAQSIITEAASLFVSLFSSTNSKSEWELWARLLRVLEAPDNVLIKIDTLSSNAGFYALLSLQNHGVEKARLIASSLNDERISILKKSASDGVIQTELMDEVARFAVARYRKQPKGPIFAVSLLAPARVFVITKQLLTIIRESRSTRYVDLWNSKVVPHFSNSPPFVSRSEKEKLYREIPSLKLDNKMLAVDATLKREPESSLTSTPKRPRRQILTGSVPPSLSTPPPSSDPVEDNLPSSADELCSSPPRHAVPPLPSWHNSQERARVLKRVIMGLNMQDAMQGMKRTECEMIYNLLFRACVDLHTHLSDTAPVRPEADVENARKELETVLELRQRQEEREVEEARLRKIKREADLDEGMRDDDDELSDSLNEEEIDEDEEDVDEYLINKRSPRKTPYLPVGQRNLPLKT